MICIQSFVPFPTFLLLFHFFFLLFWRFFRVIDQVHAHFLLILSFLSVVPFSVRTLFFLWHGVPQFPHHFPDLCCGGVRQLILEEISFVVGKPEKGSDWSFRLLHGFLIGVMTLTGFLALLWLFIVCFGDRLAVLLILFGRFIDVGFFWGLMVFLFLEIIVDDFFHFLDALFKDGSDL